MAEKNSSTSELQGKIIFMSMFNDIEWWTSQNESKFLRTAVEVANTCTNEGLVSAHPRFPVDEDDSAGRPVGFELLHRCSKMHPELLFFFVCRVFTRSMRNHKVQEGSRVRSTPSDYQESREMSLIVSIVKFHDAVIHNWQPALLSLSAAPQYLRYEEPWKIPASRDPDPCNPTTSVAASCIAISRSSTFPSIIVPANLDLLSLSSFGCSVRTLVVA